MKRLLVIVLLISLVGCTSVDVERFRESFKQEMVAEVQLSYHVMLDDEEKIISDEDYYLEYDNGLSVVKVDNSKFFTKDKLSFLDDGNKYYRLDDYWVMVDKLLPTDVRDIDIKSINKRDNVISIVFEEAFIKDWFALGEDDKILEQQFKWTVDGDLIVAEEYGIKYLKQNNEYYNAKKAIYRYEDVNIDTSVFDYQDIDYTDYKGVCRFDNDVVEEEIMVVDDMVKSIVRTTKSPWENMSFAKEDKEAYINNLYMIYQGIEGVDFSLEFDDEYLETKFIIDVEKLSDNHLQLLNVKQGGNDYIHDLYSRGFVCD